MELYQFTDAFSASFFGLLGIWAAVVRRHWFLRLAVVGGFLLSALLIPAYEIVIEFALQMAIIVVVVKIARRDFSWRPRFSLETILLLMVVAAVVAAIAARLSTMSALMWLQLTLAGVFMAYAALVCLWIACGRASRRRRVVLGLVAIVSMPVILHFGHAVQGAIRMQMFVKAWWPTFASYYEWHYLPTWCGEFLPTIALGVVLMLAALLLCLGTGWFTEKPTVAARTPASAIAARIALCTLITAMVAPLFVILAIMLNPPAIPQVELPNPNGYDDFIAAGKLAPPNIDQQIPQTRSLTPIQFRRLFDSLMPVAERVQTGLKKQCHVSHPFIAPHEQYRDEVERVSAAWCSLFVRLQYLEKYGSNAEYIEAYLLHLRFCHEWVRGGGVDGQGMQSWCPSHLQEMLGSLSASDCRRLAADLAEVESRREPYEKKQAVQAIIDQHSNWETHLRYLLKRWSGDEPNALSYDDLESFAEFRLQTLDLALQAYHLEHGAPPADLDALVPEYLPASPVFTDPVDNKPMRYVFDGKRYKVYSIGPNRQDDGGIESQPFQYDGDTVAFGPHKPPLWKQLQKRAIEWASTIQKAWQAAAAAAKEGQSN